MREDLLRELEREYEQIRSANEKEENRRKEDGLNCGDNEESMKRQKNE